MTNEDEPYHVVIRLPFKRPEGFIEPPSIVWTDEMEHQLWQYMSQKNRDWNSIAEQLGVPTPYVVRHAAFIYETQLRGIHQQMRINTNNISLSSRNTKSPIPSSKPRSTSFRSSLKSSQLQQSQQHQSQPQQQHHQAVESNSNLLQRSNTASSSRLQTAEHKSERSSISNNSSVYKSTTTMTSGPANSNSSNNTVKASDYPNTQASLPASKEQQSVRQSLKLDSSSQREQQRLEYRNDPLNSRKSSAQSINAMQSAKSQSAIDDSSSNSTNSNDFHIESHQQGRSSTEDEEKFSSHFERMRLQVEEPAFLPPQPMSASSSSCSLQNSRQQLSMSLQSLKRNNTNTYLPLAAPLSTSSLSANRPSSSSSSSSSQLLFKTTNNNPSASIMHTAATNSAATATITEPTSRTASTASDVHFETALPYTPQQFLPSNMRSTSSSPRSHKSTNNNTTAASTAPGSSTSNESALNSIGSSFSDLSDSSITQSALEEAFLSKFNQGASKMSLLNFSHRYKD